MIELRTGLLASLLCLAAPAGANAELLTGRTRVVDGDSLVVGGERVRLHAIDAPELHEPLGARARMEMERIVGKKAVRCESHGADRYGDAVAT